MTVQMTVRIPDELARHIDKHVAAGHAPSRAAMIATALREHMRREAQQREFEVLSDLVRRGQDPYPDLAGLAEWASRQPTDVD